MANVLQGAARDTIAALRAEFEAEIARLKAQIVEPVTAKAEQAQIAAPTHYTKAEIAAGGGFPCATCGKRVKTAKRALVCGNTVTGHATLVA